MTYNLKNIQTLYDTKSKQELSRLYDANSKSIVWEKKSTPTGIANSISFVSGTKAFGISVTIPNGVSAEAYVNDVLKTTVTGSGTPQSIYGLSFEIGDIITLAFKSNLTSISTMFSNLNNSPSSFDLSNLVGDGIVNIGSLFLGLTTVKSITFGNNTLPQLSSMASCFSGCSGINTTLDLSKINFSKIIQSNAADAFNNVSAEVLINKLYQSNFGTAAPNNVRWV